ncbi:MAG: DUF4336 domain-containing protein [Cyanobacteriota bacterium]|nr:DUF4336 domain-containing protein [Cyanobacteriota bacterium]
MSDQHWPWWPLLPLYPYGRRRTLVRELIAEQVWSFEQLQGIWYVAVPIRMTVIRLSQGLLAYGPIPATAEVVEALKGLELRWGPLRTIVLPTASGLEHKVGLPALARAFPQAEVWVAPGQWSFPLPLPSAWLGIPADRTRVLVEQGLPHGDELDWRLLGPLDLGLGSFAEVACLHRASGCALITDALVAPGAEPPAVFGLDPTPLLFHGRNRGDEPLEDSPERRQRGWQRLLLFASYLRPAGLDIPPLKTVLATALAPGCRGPRCHFGLFPFRWQSRWQDDLIPLLAGDDGQGLGVAPVLERLVFPRSRERLLNWIRDLAEWPQLAWLVPAHYDAPLSCPPERLERLARAIEARPWAPDRASWSTLAAIDRTLVRLKLVPASDQSSKSPGSASSESA